MTKRTTISVPVDTAPRTEEAASDGPVSASLTAVVRAHRDEAELERQREAFYADVAPSRSARRIAEAMLERLTTPLPV